MQASRSNWSLDWSLPGGTLAMTISWWGCLHNAQEDEWAFSLLPDTPSHAPA